MDSKKSVSYLLMIIGVLVLALAGSVGYILGDDNNQNKTPAITSNDAVMQEIEELKTMYDSKIAEKTTSFKELKAEQAKVQKLVFELEKTKANANSLLKYKTQYKSLEAKMYVLVDEILVLKNKKTSAVTKVKNTKPITFDNNSNQIKTTNFSVKKQTADKKETVSKVKKSEIPTKNTTKVEVKDDKQIATPEVYPAKIVEVKTVEINVNALKATCFTVKSAGKKEETNSASKTDFIKISFTINGNPSAVSEEKKYYIQIINPKNNVIGKKATEYFADKSLMYSFTKTVNLSNETITVTQDLYGETYEKGAYFVNVFDKSKLVANSSFTLK